MKPNQVERLEDLDQPLEKVLDELMDGDILVFERTEPSDCDLELPTAKDYFKLVVECWVGDWGGGGGSVYCILLGGNAKCGINDNM